MLDLQEIYDNAARVLARREQYPAGPDRPRIEDCLIEISRGDLEELAGLVPQPAPERLQETVMVYARACEEGLSRGRIVAVRADQVQACVEAIKGK